MSQQHHQQLINVNAYHASTANNTNAQSTAPVSNARILCCECGTVIAPNSANMCIGCIRNRVDISEGICKQINLSFCRACERYQQPPNQWLNCALESKELLSLCLKRIKGLNKVRLTDASFIWTEPHSKRLKVKLTIQKEIFAATVLQQVLVVEVVVCNMQCPDCTKLMAKDTWKAVVQVRQKVEHKKTFLYLEQLILKNALEHDIVNIKQSKDGLDFYYSSKSHALRMVEFLHGVAPVRHKLAEQLISEDIQSGTAHFKFNLSVEIVPICKDDLVILPLKVAQQLGSINPVVLCSRVGSSVHFLDLLKLQSVEMQANAYWRQPFESLCCYKDLVEFLVLDVERNGSSGSGAVAAHNGKYSAAYVTVVRSTDFGVNNRFFSVRTHLGHVLKPGDSVLGYDLSNSNFNNDHLDALMEHSRYAGTLPDVVLVKKSYRHQQSHGASRKKGMSHSNSMDDGDSMSYEDEEGQAEQDSMQTDQANHSSKGSGSRVWRLKTLNKEVDDNMRKGDVAKMAADMDDFLADIEQDKELRSSINLYKNKTVLSSMSAVGDVDAVAAACGDIDLAELLDDMDLEDTDQ